MEGVRRRSLSGASALLTRKFTRSKSNRAKRRATISVTPHDHKIHLRIVPNIENINRSLIFEIVDREMEIGEVIKMGRYSDRRANETNCMSFKSKVVSRYHCEVWAESNGKLYIRDTKSSSGTFLNRMRLSPAGVESRSYEIKDGDIIQLGVDFQGGREEIYRSVKMKFQVNHSKRPRPLSFNINAYRNIRQISQLEHSSGSTEECCICLYALAPFQALFVSPCTHTFHFKCIRPLLSSYPGFQCPICRKYSDLEANLAVEVDDAEFSGQASPSPPPLPLPVSSVLTPVIPSSALSPSSGQERTSNITCASSPSSSEDEDDSPPSPHVYSNNDLAEISLENTRERKSHLMDKIKMVFLDKSHRKRPLSMSTDGNNNRIEQTASRDPL